MTTELTKAPNWFSDDDMVNWDLLIEQGFKVEELDDNEARTRWVQSIRGVIDGTYHEFGWPRHLWSRWMLPHLVGVVRVGMTEDLFKTIDSEFQWSGLMSRTEYQLWLMQTWEHAERVGAKLAFNITVRR